MVLYCVPLFVDTITGWLTVPSAIHASKARGPNMVPQLGDLLVAPKVGYQYHFFMTRQVPQYTSYDQ